LVKHASQTGDIIGEVIFSCGLKIPNGLPGFGVYVATSLEVYQKKTKNHHRNGTASTTEMTVEGMGINGFGRIGRLVFRAASGNPDAEARRLMAGER